MLPHTYMRGPEGASVCVYLYACQTAVGRTHKRGKERGEKEGRGSGVEGLAAVGAKQEEVCLCKGGGQSEPCCPLPPSFHEIAIFLLNAIRGCEGLLPREPKKKLKEEKWYYKVHRL